MSRSRYNQHVSNGAFIIEVGTTGNTLGEAKTSMKYLANVMESFK
ncbi:MAG: stage II sporulation protein P [Clostridia bacterium]|nr:stage II sporulation protein P [Clostridia bacterium]